MKIARFTVLAAAAALAACASMKPLPQLDADARSSLGTIGVITVGPAVGGKVDGPVGVGSQAAEGFLEGTAGETVGHF